MGLEGVHLWVFRFLSLMLDVLNPEVHRPVSPLYSSGRCFHRSALALRQTFTLRGISRDPRRTVGSATTPGTMTVLPRRHTAQARGIETLPSCHRKRSQRWPSTRLVVVRAHPGAISLDGRCFSIRPRHSWSRDRFHVPWTRLSRPLRSHSDPSKQHSRPSATPNSRPSQATAVLTGGAIGCRISIIGSFNRYGCKI